ncbi:MAG: cobalamin-binding protein [Acidobacteriota bacterium]|nr:MAG: cobalamin-binding protein [Acidobacteriota bacterium]
MNTSSAQRIVSLLPSATEIICSLGLEDGLVGVTHECDFPPGVEQKPQLTASKIIHGSMDSREIDHAVRKSLDGHGSIYDLDEEKLRELNPDLIVTQELCDVCAVSYETVRKAARRYTADATVVSLEPNTIGDIFENIVEVGELAGVRETAEKVVAGLRQRLDALLEKTSDIRDRPKVMMLEWLDPPFAPGHWVPEQVEAAGGECVLGRAGEKSVTTTFEEVAESNAEIVVLIPCGYDTHGILEQLERTSFPSVLKDLPAFANGNVWALDASAYFSRPGPRVVDGAEIIAKIFHPDVFGVPAEGEAVRLGAEKIRFE